MTKTGWDNQMRGRQIINQVHVPTGDRWRGCDGMIRWEVIKQLTKFAYILGTDPDEEDEWDDQMRGLQAIQVDQVHVLSGDE